MPIDLIATTDLNAQLFADRHSAQALSQTRADSPTDGPSFQSQFATMMQTRQEVRERSSVETHPDATQSSSRAESATAVPPREERESEAAGAENARSEADERETRAGGGDDPVAAEGVDNGGKTDGSHSKSAGAAAGDARDESAPVAPKTDAAVTVKRASARGGEVDGRRGEHRVDWSEAAARKLSSLRHEQSDPDVPTAISEAESASTARLRRAGLQSSENQLPGDEESVSREPNRASQPSISSIGDQNQGRSNPPDSVKTKPETTEVAGAAAQAARSDRSASAGPREPVFGVTTESRSVGVEDGEKEQAQSRVVLVDLRERAKGAGEERGQAETRVSKDQSGNVSALKTADSGGSQNDAGTELFRSFDLSPGNARAAAQGGLRQPGTSFEGLRNALVQQLRENGNGEIVRQAQIVLRNNDSGQIRLTLKPEHLGSVRISLNLHDGHIGGRIIVENTTVKEVFDQNLGELSRAFQQQGLQTGSLEVSVANSGGEHGRQEDSRSGRWVVRHLEQAVPVVYETQEEHDLVNLVV